MTYITRLQRAGVSPRETMELARHSDMRLTMKTYTDAAALPLMATVRRLPAFDAKFDDTQRDSQTLVAGGQFVSPSVIGLKPIKVGKTVGNIDANHEASPAVTVGHQNENGGERGDSNPTISGENIKDSRADSRLDSRIQVVACPDLARVVTAWAKLPAPLKAAILAIVSSQTSSPDGRP